MESQEAERIYDAYLQRLQRSLKRAPEAFRQEALREVQSHIDEEWQALGGDVPALQATLQRLGSPEEYGRDLALQLMLLPRPGSQRPVKNLLQAGLFWVTTSLLGAPLVICLAAAGGFALGMLATAMARGLGSPMWLLDARNAQIFSYRFEQLRFPPQAWSPLVIALAGLLPAAVVTWVLYRFWKGWVNSRLARVGLKHKGLTLQDQNRVASNHSPRWERRAALAMLGFAALGLGSCVLFTILGELVPFGKPGTVSLPQDFFRTPLTALAFLGMLAFLSSPALGLLWAARRDATR